MGLEFIFDVKVSLRNYVMSDDNIYLNSIYIFYLQNNPINFTLSYLKFYSSCITEEVLKSHFLKYLCDKT